MKGLGNIAKKCLGGMPQLLNPAIFVLRPSTQLISYYSNFQKFTVYSLLHSVELERLLADVVLFPSSTMTAAFSAQDTSGLSYSPDISLHSQKGLVSTLSLDQD